ncbi:MAG: hypothetical protein OEY89_17345, partial [Gammaproteobacteria bacterium]|nr:hypothetical protein [Gammaproteobacteria bacterium]
GELPKSIISFDFYTIDDVLKSKLTYVLNGTNDHWAHANTITNGINYVTYIQNKYDLNKSYNISFSNLLDEYNVGAIKINAPLLEKEKIGRVIVNFHAWYNQKGDVSVKHSGWLPYLNVEKIPEPEKKAGFGVFLAIMLATLLIAYVVTLVGSHLWTLIINNDERYDANVKTGFSFFIGITLFIVLYKLLGDVFVGASTAAYLSLGILICTHLYLVSRAKTTILPSVAHYDWKRVGLLVLLFLSIYIFVTLAWSNVFLYPPGKPSNPYQMIGTLHSGRYTNIATYIYNSNELPILGQNFAQSMLASASMFFSANKPFMALSIWLSVSLFFLTLLTYGIFGRLNFTGLQRTLATVIFLFGNYSLSLTHVLTIDSGSPFMLNGYTDTILSVGSLFVFLLSIYLLNTKSLYKLLIVSIILGAGWNWYAPQNIVICGALLAYMYLASLRNKHFDSKPIFIFSFIMLLSIIVGAAGGGMLTPQKLFKGDAEIPGMHSVGKPSMNIDGLKMQYYIRGDDPNTFWKSGTNNQVSLQPFYEKIINKDLGNIFHSISNAVYNIEERLWNAFRVIFFPILGLIFFCYLAWNKININKINSKFPIELTHIFIFIYITGFSIVFFVGHPKWELSRFLIPAYAIGMLLFVYNFKYVTERLKIRKQNKLWLFLTLFLIFGTTITTFGVIFSNVIYSPKAAFERFEVILNASGMIG